MEILWNLYHVIAIPIIQRVNTGYTQNFHRSKDTVSSTISTMLGIVPGYSLDRESIGIVSKTGRWSGNGLYSRTRDSSLKESLKWQNPERFALYAAVAHLEILTTTSHAHVTT